MVIFVFFFFKQKTAYEMRISDWSSDVCSSDLLIRWVRAPGPWRPTKLRFEVEAQRCCGATRSPLVARHMEQPAWRQSKPASRNILSSPSRSACAFTRPEPGTTRSEEHTSELQSLMRISYAVFCLKKKQVIKTANTETTIYYED